MRKKINIPIFAVWLLIILCGCKPSKTSVSGQVFIVTKGGENVKLGDAKVLLIEKKQVKEFFQQKRAAIESEKISNQRKLTRAKDTVKKTDVAYKAFLADAPNRMTNAGYFTVKAEQNAIERDLAALDKRLKDLPAGAEAAITKAIKQIEADYGKQIPLKTKMDKIEADEKTEADKLLAAIDKAQAGLAAITQKVEYFPTVEDYLTGFYPNVFQETSTDADGRFSLSYPRNKRLTFFVSTQRALLNETEKYYWLVDAPVGVETAQVLLSNSRLIYADPDGYLRPTKK